MKRGNLHSDAPTGRIPCEIKIETGEAFTSQIVPKISVSYKRNGTDFSPQALKITSEMIILILGF